MLVPYNTSGPTTLDSCPGLYNVLGSTMADSSIAGSYYALGTIMCGSTMQESGDGVVQCGDGN